MPPSSPPGGDPSRQSGLLQWFTAHHEICAGHGHIDLQIVHNNLMKNTTLTLIYATIKKNIKSNLHIHLALFLSHRGHHHFQSIYI